MKKLKLCSLKSISVFSRVFYSKRKKIKRKSKNKKLVENQRKTELNPRQSKYKI
jgi:hypothetical protein